MCCCVDGGFHFPLFHSAPHPSGFPLTSSSLLKDASSSSTSFQSLLKRDMEGMLGTADTGRHCTTPLPYPTLLKQ